MKRFACIVILSFQFFSFAQKDIKHIVYFDTDTYTITETEQYRLLSFLRDIEAVDVEKVSIYGFCDDRGSLSYNLLLSQNRANTIKEVFSANEFNEALITNVDGKGEVLLKLIDNTDLQQIRGLNRKVEIRVTPVYPPKQQKGQFSSTEDIINGTLKVGDKILLKDLLFVRGYSYLIPESKKALNDIASVLVKQKDLHFTIQGHVCCTNGSRDALDAKTKKRNLSYARAKYIYNYLANKGVSKHRMKYVGLKRKFPLGGPQKYDRRVELLVTKVN